MIAKIKTKDGKTYDSAVFAVCWDGWETRVVAFDEKLETLRIVYMYDAPPGKRGVTKLFIVDVEERDFVQIGKWKGLSCLLEEESLLKTIEQGKALSETIMRKCRAMQEEVCISEWYEIKDSDSVKNLMSATWYFHDGLILRAERQGADAEIDIEIWEDVIRLKLTNAQLSEKCAEGYGSLGEIFEASVFFENGLIYWTDFESCTSTDEIKENDCWFSAEKICWKLLIEESGV